MDPSPTDTSIPCVTRARLAQDFRALGVQPGSLVILHASVRAVGFVVGGPDVVLHALRDALGPDGTLMMYVGWPDGTQEMAEWPEEKQALYRQHAPAFDPATSRAVTEWSILTEYLRTTPGALRSNHPEASVAAVGPLAAHLVADHPLQHGYGRGSPLDKLVAARGQVLLLGSPLDSVTLLHFTEEMVDLPHKRTVRYREPMLVDGVRTWVDVEELDTTNGIAPWDGEGDYFPALMKDHLDTGAGRRGNVGYARSFLLDAHALHTFGLQWMARHLCPAPRGGLTP